MAVHLTVEEPEEEHLSLLARAESAPTSESEDALGLLETAQRVSEMARVRKQQVWKATLLTVIVPSLIILAVKVIISHDAWMGLITNPAVIYALIGATMLVAVGLPMGAMLSEYRSRKRVRAATEKLVAGDDKRAVGTLLDVLGMDDACSRAIAEEALIRLLPCMGPRDGATLTAPQRRRLLTLLWQDVDSPLYKAVAVSFRPANARSVDLRVAALKALENIGDVRSLPLVELLAGRLAKTAAQTRVQEAARNCLPTLRLLAARATDARNLLRATERSDDDAGDLLRSSISPSSGTSEDLLRPVHASTYLSPDNHPRRDSSGE